jgi:hypothetical protein
MLNECCLEPALNDGWFDIVGKCLNAEHDQSSLALQCCTAITQIVHVDEQCRCKHELTVTSRHVQTIDECTA